MRGLEESLRRMPRPVRIVALAMLINRVGTMALPFLVVYLVDARGFSGDGAGRVLLAYGAGSVLAGPLASHQLPRRGPRVVMIFALMLSAAAMAALPWLPSLPLLAVGTFVWGLAGEAFRPACAVVVSHHLAAEHRREGFALLRLAANLGMAIGPALGGVLAGRSYAALFALDALTSAAAALALALPASRALSAASSETRAAEWVPAARGALALHLTAIAMVALVAYQYGSSGALYMTRDLRLSLAEYGLAFAASGWMIVLFELPLTRAVRAVPHRRLLVVGTLLAAVGFGSLGFAQGSPGIWGATLVLTAGEMALGPAAAARVAELEPADRRGSYLGFYNAVWSAACAVGPWLGLRSFAALGPRHHWGAVAALGVLAALLFALAPEPTQARTHS